VVPQLPERYLWFLPADVGAASSAQHRGVPSDRSRCGRAGRSTDAWPSGQV